MDTWWTTTPGAAAGAAAGGAGAGANAAAAADPGGAAATGTEAEAGHWWQPEQGLRPELGALATDNRGSSGRRGQPLR